MINSYILTFSNSSTHSLYLSAQTAALQVSLISVLLVLLIIWCNGRRKPDYLLQGEPDQDTRENFVAYDEEGAGMQRRFLSNPHSLFNLKSCHRKFRSMFSIVKFAIFDQIFIKNCSLYKNFTVQTCKFSNADLLY